MVQDSYEMPIRFIVSMMAGGLIGLERSYYGRPAGFRTHTLVCMASTLLMLVTIYQRDWFNGTLADTVRIDPTRMAQGIMTGIGFLGAGVIMKEGASIRGLTTAASIWITAAIGILAGVGFYSALILVTILTMSTLTLYRFLEERLPGLIYIRTSIRFQRDDKMTESEIRNLMNENGLAIANMSYAVLNGGDCFEYDMVVKTRLKHEITLLSQALTENKRVVEFRISSIGD